MKKLRTKLDRYFDQLDRRWRKLPVRTQHKYTLYFFVGYLLLTISVVFHVWYSTAKSENDMVIEHIENPVFKKKKGPAMRQDSLQTILKSKNYGKK